MFRNLLFSAIGAGVAVAVCVSLVQAVTTEPLILGAEVFEKAEAHPVVPLAAGHAETAEPAAAASSSGRAELTPAPVARVHEEDGWEPADGIERTLYTMLANLLVGVATTLMLLGVMVVKGEPIDARRGALWGIFGFIAASLLPSLGLPPELPGSAAADIAMRQLWWLSTAAAAATGLGLLAFGRSWLPRVAAIALILAPHLIGAPEPPSLEAAYPAGMAGEFVVASLVLSLLLWSLSGLVGGWLHARLARAG